MGKDETIEKVRRVVEEGLAKAFPEIKLTSRDVITEGTRVRCIWTVTAGVVPGIPMKEHTMRWVITSENWEEENEMTDAQFKAKFPDGKSTYQKFRDEAHAYAAGLNHPTHLNWVRVDWMWM